MNEDQWLSCTHLTPMWEFLQGKVSDRKPRLFACACCRVVWQLLDDERSRDAVATAERYAEGQTGEASLLSAHQEARVAYQQARTPLSRACRRSAVAASAPELLILTKGGVFNQVGDAARSAAEAVAYTTDEVVSTERWWDAVNAEQRWQRMLLRDLVRNPFSPLPTVEESWRTPTVLALANTIDGERCFEDMPVLADALEESRCDNAEMLAHCRQQELPHARGCWVVDLLLRKE